MDGFDRFVEMLQKLPGVTSPAWQRIYGVLAILAGAGLLWLLIKAVLAMFQKRLVRYRFFEENPSLFPLIRKTARLALIGLAALLLARFFALPIAEKVVIAAVILLLAGPGIRLLNASLDTLRRHVAARTENKVDDIVFDLLHRFSGVLIYATAVVIALDVLGINVMPFIAGAGVAGLAVGFAAKDTLSNLIAGVLLIIDRPFEIGDRIEVWSAPRDSATWGDVIDIGLRATKIKTTDNIIIIIPNNEIMKRDIVNYTHLSTRIRVRINIGVSYDADTVRAKAAILDVANAINWVSRAPEPKVVVRHFGESSVDLQLRVWIEDARKRMDTISTITDRVKERFAEDGIEIPYPKRDITVAYKGEATG